MVDKHQVGMDMHLRERRQGWVNFWTYRFTRRPGMFTLIESVVHLRYLNTFFFSIGTADENGRVRQNQRLIEQNKVLTDPDAIQ